MIIAAGQGATAAQAINRDIFEERLATHSLFRLRRRQLETRTTRPQRRREPKPPTRLQRVSSRARFNRLSSCAA
jgi:hypothetical protein